MALSVRGGLAALSLAIPTALAIAFFWIRSRTKDEDTTTTIEEEKRIEKQVEDLVELPKTTLEPLEVQEKLEVIQRQRLFTLEEEKFVIDDEAEVVKEEFTSETMTEEVVKEAKAATKDTAIESHEEEVRTLTKGVCDIDLKVINPDTVDIKIVTTENKVDSESRTMMVEEEKIPDVSSALRDPLCSSFSTPSSSPTKSDEENNSWNDIIQEELDNEVGAVTSSRNRPKMLNLDEELSEKLAGLGLGDGRHPDSGVVSPSEENDDKMGGGEGGEGRLYKTNPDSQSNL